MLSKLLTDCVQYLKPVHLELPLGLLARMVLGDATAVEQFANCVHSTKQVHSDSN